MKNYIPTRVICPNCGAKSWWFVHKDDRDNIMNWGEMIFTCFDCKEDFKLNSSTMDITEIYQLEDNIN